MCSKQRKIIVSENVVRKEGILIKSLYNYQTFRANAPLGSLSGRRAADSEAKHVCLILKIMFQIMS